VGCSINQATGSLLTEAVQSKTLPEIAELSELFHGMMSGEALSETDGRRLGDLQELDGVRQFPVRVKCALLAWSTLDDAIDDYRRDRPPS
jgi:nitrogen fixation NifU-like protein